MTELLFEPESRVEHELDFEEGHWAPGEASHAATTIPCQRQGVIYMQSLQGMLPRITTRRTNMNNMNSLFTWRFLVVIMLEVKLQVAGGSLERRAKAGQVHTNSFSSKLVAMDDIQVETVIQRAANVNTPDYGERDVENTRRLRQFQSTDQK